LKIFGDVQNLKIVESIHILLKVCIFIFSKPFTTLIERKSQNEGKQLSVWI